MNRIVSMNLQVFLKASNYGTFQEKQKKLTPKRSAPRFRRQFPRGRRVD